MDNTFRVVPQGTTYTICSVKITAPSAHNSCMGKRGEKTEFKLETGKRLAAARDDRGWRQLDLANASGWFSEEDSRKPGRYGPSTISMYEQGSRGISAEDALRFAELLPQYHPAYYAGLISKRESAILLAARDTESPPRREEVQEPVPKKAKKQATSRREAA